MLGASQLQIFVNRHHTCVVYFRSSDIDSSHTSFVYVNYHDPNLVFPEFYSSVITTVVTGREVFLCRTVTDPVAGAVVAVAAEGEVEAEEEVEEVAAVMATVNDAVGIRPPLAAPGRPTVVVPECQRMGMVKAEANNTIHRKVCSTKSCFLKLFTIFLRYSLIVEVVLYLLIPRSLSPSSQFFLFSK